MVIEIVTIRHRIHNMIIKGLGRKKLRTLIITSTNSMQMIYIIFLYRLHTQYKHMDHVKLVL